MSDQEKAKQLGSALNLIFDMIPAGGQISVDFFEESTVQIPSAKAGPQRVGVLTISKPTGIKGLAMKRPGSGLSVLRNERGNHENQKQTDKQSDTVRRQPSEKRRRGRGRGAADTES